MDLRGRLSGPPPCGEAAFLRTSEDLRSFTEACRHWTFPVWTTRLNGRWQCGNKLAEAWLSEAPWGTVGDAPPDRCGVHTAARGKIEDIFKRALAYPHELPTQEAIILGRAHFEVFVLRLDDAAGRAVGIVVTAVPLETTRRG